MVQPLENGLQFLKISSVQLPHDPAIPLLGGRPEVLKWAFVHPRPSKHEAQSQTAAFVPKRGHAPQVTTDKRWILRRWSRHTRARYAALKRKGFPTLAATWVSLEGTVLREKRQAPEDKYYVGTLV